VEGLTIPAHLTINEPQGKADCSVCRMGVTATGSRVPAMLAAFIASHAVHRGETPTGLTASGRMSRAARDVLLPEN